MKQAGIAYATDQIIDLISNGVRGIHIYTMNYAWMLESHKANNADATIGVFEVPWEEAPRFGIMATDKATGRITEFQEKPKEPKSNLASMGIYIFTTKFLKKYLLEDGVNESSSHDFGNDLIPKMLNDGAPTRSTATGKMSARLKASGSRIWICCRIRRPLNSTAIGKFIPRIRPCRRTTLVPKARLKKP